MLVLTRKATETIRIGDNVVLKIICTGTKSVRIGIKAPDEVRIMRGELDDSSRRRLPAAEVHAECPPCEPIVADAVSDEEPSLPTSVAEPVVIGPISAQKFIHEFNDVLPGRSIRRMLEARKQAAAAK